ncbi:MULTISPECIES: tRNA preQ1(34) S-adenosylmethionine ribosyltransferase-isomerase QueA [Arcobacteraceae]|uniref:tRNA preQ1(34) S-adenosylmethionine ribosyltransferase-isomerase QueA n=1 Tax=Arcobacteraceae TaxID=2808963 RepID=UPI000DEA22CC|nr:tRNA preQ1(34) S-adenosylmethionine ribosyltransferase-isomerase QueA [Arcobacter sp. CECT 9188]RBQ26667.1 tRNA preQ1(34) S-adenosylmethionine ribosyltransferase-isomerase QueA [Arcobacter sp. CECT 9188]
MLDVLKTSSYDFSLPQNQIASYPINPPDSAKLLVFNREKNEVYHSTFKDILEFLPKDLSIFLNDTKVIKARIFGKKDTGANIELLLNKPLFMNRYLVMIRGKVKIGTEIFFNENLVAKVLELNEDGSRIVEFFKNNDNKKLDFLSLVNILNQIGHIPLPPYMQRNDEKEDETNYQTLFAKNYGAVAAPTASLHFTPELLKKLETKYGLNYLTLHVGAGTFKPVDVEDILSHPMHSEYFEIGIEAKKNLDNAEKVLAVGTTVTRTIEYYSRTNKIQGECDLFLNPLNKPIKVDYLLTNFHLPKSTLIMLVASFIGLEKTLELYNIAIKENYRFYSYGDGMLII